MTTWEEFYRRRAHSENFSCLMEFNQVRTSAN